MLYNLTFTAALEEPMRELRLELTGMSVYSKVTGAFEVRVSTLKLPPWPECVTRSTLASMLLKWEVRWWNCDGTQVIYPLLVSILSSLAGSFSRLRSERDAVMRAFEVMSLREEAILKCPVMPPLLEQIEPFSAVTD